MNFIGETLGRTGRQHRLCAECGKEPVKYFGDTCWTCKGTSRRSSKQTKIYWLLANQSVWEGFERHPGHIIEIFHAMQDAGLYSPFTKWTHSDITSLVSDARKIRRESQ